MKKLSLIAALALGGLLACSTIANAQDASKDSKKGGKRGASVEQRLQEMGTQLGLTDEQKPKVKAVLEETAKKMKEVPQDERRTKMPEIMAEQGKKLKEILTPEQYQKLQDARKNGKKKKSE